MRGIFAVRRMLRNGVYCGSLYSSLGEIASVSSSNPATVPVSYSCSFSSLTKPLSSIPISKFQSDQHNFSRNHCSSSSSDQSKVVMVDSEEQFNSLLRKVQDESLPAVLYFTAVWCGPCKLISPLIGELSEKYTKVTTYKIDIDQENLRGALNKLEISAVPTFYFFLDGKKVSEIVGADVQRLKTTMHHYYK
ncbi:hypothetical protein R6Q57_001517 [Mikania cordata]